MTEHYTCRHCGETILTTPIWMNPRRSVRTAMTVTTQTVIAAVISSASARPITPVRVTATSIRSATTATRAALPASRSRTTITSPSRCSVGTVIAILA